MMDGIALWLHSEKMTDSERNNRKGGDDEHDHQCRQAWHHMMMNFEKQILSFGRFKSKS